MQRTLSLAVAFLMLAHAGAALPAPGDIKSQVSGFAPGDLIDVRLNNNQTVRGARGAVSDSGFSLMDSHQRERQFAFADVASVVRHRSHIGRNIAITAGVIVAALIVFVAVIGRQVSDGHGG
jgi:hypothetical protein